MFNDPKSSRIETNFACHHATSRREFLAKTGLVAGGLFLNPAIGLAEQEPTRRKPAKTPAPRGTILVPRSKLVFGKAGQKQDAVLSNQTDRPVRLRLEVMDRKGAFEIPRGL